MPGKNFKYVLTIIIMLLALSAAKQGFAQHRTLNLIISYKMVNFTGKWRKAIAVNNQIPGPTLHFKEGDQVTINVYNNLDKGTAIHWHGVIVPWQMDGVEHVSQRAIPPGGIFHYQFTLHQSGTYWYHAHADAQEQDGLYGAFIIDPVKKPPYHYTKDYVVVLSDWSNISGKNIHLNLKRDGDYFSPRFPLQPSLKKFLHDYRHASFEERQKLLADYKSMQQSRMSIYDISDVAYDAFLLNGHSKLCPWNALVHVGDVVRLRFIGAAASTIFKVKINDAAMQMVHAQGNDIKPYLIKEFSIAPGETYDVLVKIQKNCPYIIYAESIDTKGAAYGALVTSPHQLVDYAAVPHFPEPLPVTRDMMTNMMMSQMHEHEPSMQTGMKMGLHSKMTSHSSTPTHNMKMPTEPSIIGDTITPAGSYSAMTVGTKYQNLKAAVKTNDPHKPIAGIIRMELFGYMDRYIWFINGLPEYRAKPIIIESNKRYRIIFTNNSMMRHPMHIHLHWFILRNGHGAYDPLLHTIEVPPGATAVADIDTDASGQAFFHCHHLYHMLAGMARVFQYSSLIQITQGEKTPQNYVASTGFYNRPIVREDEVRPIDAHLVQDPQAHAAGFYLANFLDFGEDPFTNQQSLTFKGLYGPDYHKLEIYTNDAEMEKGNIENADVDIFYWHLISQYWALKGGANYYGRPAQRSYWQPGLGIEGLMPYFIATDIRTYYHHGAAKLDIDLSRDTQLTNNFFIRCGIRGLFASKTVSIDQVGSGLNQMRYTIRPYYRVAPGWTVFVEYEHQTNYGTFKKLQLKEGEAATDDSLSLGVSVLF